MFALYFPGSLPGVDACLLNYDIVVSEFELHSHDYIHFRTNTLGKDMMNPLIPPPAIGWIVSLLFFYKGSFGIE